MARPFFASRTVRLDDVFNRDLDQRGHGNVDRQPQIDTELGEESAGLERVFKRQLGQFGGGRLGRIGGERSGKHHAVLGVTHACIGLGACELLFAQGNLGLVPELNPFVLDRVIELELGRDRGRGAKFELLHELDDRFGLKGFLQYGQHLQLVLRADALDVLENCSAARAHQLHGAAKASLAEGDDGLDRVGRLERDIDEDERRRT